LVNCGGGPRKELGKPGSRRWCGGRDEAFVRGKLHAKPLDFAVGGLGSSDQEVLASFNAGVGCLYAKVIDVKAYAKPGRDGSDLVDGRFEHGP
jgi:hypothetical protein